MRNQMLNGMRIGEVSRVLATMFGTDTEDVQDWLIVISVPCSCGEDECQTQGTGIMSSRSNVEQGQGQDFILHMAATVVEQVALSMKDDPHA